MELSLGGYPFMATRKTPDQQLEELRDQEQKLKRRIQKKSAQVRAVQRKQDTRRKIIAGAIALEHTEHDPAFAAKFLELLKEHVTRPEDRKLFEL